MAHQANLTWTRSIDDTQAAGQGYNVYRSTVPGAEAAPALNGSTLITAAAYTDTTVVVGQKYDYIVTFVANGTESVHSNEFLNVVILPAAPTSLVVTVS